MRKVERERVSRMHINSPSLSKILTQRTLGSPSRADALGRFSKYNSNCSVPSPISSSVVLISMQNCSPFIEENLTDRD